MLKKILRFLSRTTSQAASPLPNDDEQRIQEAVSDLGCSEDVVPSKRLRLTELSQLAKFAVEGAAEDPRALVFSHVYLSAVCTEMMVLDRQLSETNGKPYNRAPFLDVLQTIVGADWVIEPQTVRGDFVICFPEPKETLFHRGSPNALTIH